MLNSKSEYTNPNVYLNIQEMFCMHRKLSHSNTMILCTQLQFIPQVCVCPFSSLYKWFHDHSSLAEYGLTFLQTSLLYISRLKHSNIEHEIHAATVSRCFQSLLKISSRAATNHVARDVNACRLRQSECQLSGFYLAADQ